MTSSIYGLLLEMVGMSSQPRTGWSRWPLLIACVTLLYLLVRRRTDPGLALVMILPVLGPGLPGRLCFWPSGRTS